MRQNMEPMTTQMFAEEAAARHNRELLYKITDALRAAQTAYDTDAWFTPEGMAGTSRIMEVLTDSMGEILGGEPDLPLVDVTDTDTYILPFALAMLCARLNLRPMAGADLGLLAELDYKMDEILDGEWFDE